MCPVVHRACAPLWIPAHAVNGGALRKRPRIVLHYAAARRRGITNDERHSYPLTYEPEIGAEFSPIAWRDGRLLLLDQTRLPESEEWASASNPGDVARAIAGMQVRGAPAIGVAAAYGMALAAQSAAASAMSPAVARTGADHAVPPSLSRTEEGAAGSPAAARAGANAPGSPAAARAGANAPGSPAVAQTGADDAGSPPVARTGANAAASPARARTEGGAAGSPSVAQAGAAAAPARGRAEGGAAAMGAFLSRLEADADALAAARPTAVNLGWAVRRCLDAARACGSPGEAAARILALARRMQEDDVAANRAIGRGGAALLPDSGGVLTHCNTGALATAGYGTALGVIRAAWESGKRLRVFCTETRPWMQGARLTAWEFARLGVPATLIVDSAAGALMASGRVSAVVTGADRIAANGDAANKIGTYALAALAHAHKIPFYVAAPVSTVDFGTPNGEAIPIEERPDEEVTSLGGRRIAAEGVEVWNPAFDIAPARLVSAIITERGVARPPYEASLRAVAERSEMRGAA